MFDSKRLEDYLQLTSSYGDSSLVPKNALNVKVSNIEKLSGGVTNELCSFSLTFTAGESEHRIDLVLKSYPEKVAEWFKTTRPDEDVRKYVREFQAMQSLTHIGFPVPQAYLCESDPFFLGYPFLIMSKEKMVEESITRLIVSLTRWHVCTI